MRRAIVALAATAILAGTVAPASAQVPPHDHFLTVPGTGSTVQVGPHRCALGETVQTGFLGFHVNVHLGTPTDVGPLAIRASLCGTP